jgi:SPP1 family phage portal protein
MLTSALLRQIDEYDDIDSLSGDDIRNVSDALLKIKGINSNWVKENEDVILRLRVLPIPDDAEAEYLTKTTDTERVTSRLARCREAIHTMGGVPDIQQVTGATGSTSGIALKLKFMPMEQRAGAMFKQLEKSMRKRIDVLNSITQKANQTKIENYEITMHFNMPVNRIEEWANIGALTDIVTHRTQLEMLSDIDDPDAELKGLEKEQIGKAEITAVGQSPEVAAAQQDVQVAQAMPKVDATIENSLNVIADRILAAVTRANK